MQPLERQTAAVKAVADAASVPGRERLALTGEAKRAAAELVQSLGRLPVSPEEFLEGRIQVGRLYRLRRLAGSRYDRARDLKTAVRVLFPVFMERRDALELIPAEFHAALAEAALPPAARAVEEAKGRPEPGPLEEAIALFQRIITATDPASREYGRVVGCLGVALRYRFERTGDHTDLDAAIETTRSAADVAGTPPWDRVQILKYLKLMLFERYERSGTLEDLDAAIAAIRARLALTAKRLPHRDDASDLMAGLILRFGLTGSPEALREAVTLADGREARLETAAGAWISRYTQTDDPDDRLRALGPLREAVAGLPADHPERTRFLLMLGIYLAGRFEQTGDPQLEDEAIARLREAAAGASSGTEVHIGAQGLLSELLTVRYRRTGTMSDLDEAVSAGREAAAEPGDDEFSVLALANLGSALASRFNESDTPQDLAEAARAQGAALAASAPGDPHRNVIQADLAAVHAVRFERAGGDEDLERAHTLIRATLADTPDDDPDRARRLSILAGVLTARYERDGTLADLDEAVDVMRTALALTTVRGPERASYISRLGLALRFRYERLGAMADLDEAVEAARESVAATAPAHPDYARRLANYAAAVFRRFWRAGEPADLDAAVEAARASITATAPGHPDLGRRLSAQGHYLAARSVLNQDPQGMEEAVAVARAAVVVTPAGNRRHAMYALGLGTVLAARAQMGGAASNLDESVEVQRNAARISPDDHGRALSLLNLGKSLQVRFEQRGTPEDRTEAVAAWVGALDVPGAPPSLRIEAARLAAALGRDQDPHAAAEVLRKAVGLLPDLAPGRLARADQQFALSGLAGLASDAAASALSDLSLPAAERAAWALRALEGGRTVILNQTLDIEPDLAGLRRGHEDLAARFAGLRARLDTPGGAGAVGGFEADPAGFGGSQDLAAVREEFDAVIRRIRAIPGFATFADLPSTGDLLPDAAHGTVVTFSITDLRSDALLLTADGISALPLPGVDLTSLTQLVIAFHDAVGRADARELSSAERREAQAEIREILARLWDDVAQPVLTALGHDAAVPENGTWPRVWWATGGLLGLLPLHAAGRHDAAHAGQCVMDRVVSSYTPTIRALRHSRQQAATAAGGGGSLIVAMPTTPAAPGLPEPLPLPIAALEATLLAAMLPGPLVLTEPGPDTDGRDPERVPTWAAVREALADSTIAHFACHGTHDPADPSESRLLLHDHATTPLTVARLASLRLHRAQIAYLSACRTAFHSDGSLLDESIHLANAFQFAGFPHVIATLWHIYDPIALTVAETFYTHLRTSDAGRPDPGPGSGPADRALDYSQAAAALHHAVRELRDRPGLRNLPSLWAAFIHSGA